MIRGTTPTFNIELPIETAAIKDCRVSFAQKKQTIVNKKLADCTASGKTLAVALTQEETLKFENDVYIQMQVKVLTADGKVLASDLMAIECKDCLCEEVL